MNDFNTEVSQNIYVPSCNLQEYLQFESWLNKQLRLRQYDRYFDWCIVYQLGMSVSRNISSGRHFTLSFMGSILT